MTKLVWKRACSAGTQCVEVAEAGGHVHVRDSKLGDMSPVLTFSADEWDAFIATVKRGEFDTPDAEERP